MQLTRPRGSKPSPTGKGAGVSQLESEQSQPTPSGTQNLDGDPGGGRTTTTTVDAPLTDQEKALKIEIARKYLPRIARKKLRPLEEAELAKVNGDQAATYKLMATRS
jgi:hypothetical protein